MHNVAGIEITGAQDHDIHFTDIEAIKQVSQVPPAMKCVLPGETYIMLTLSILLMTQPHYSYTYTLSGKTTHIHTLFL